MNDDIDTSFAVKLRPYGHTESRIAVELQAPHFFGQRWVHMGVLSVIAGGSGGPDGEMLWTWSGRVNFFAEDVTITGDRPEEMRRAIESWVGLLIARRVEEAQQIMAATDGGPVIHLPGPGEDAPHG